MKYGLDRAVRCVDAVQAVFKAVAHCTLDKGASHRITVVISATPDLNCKLISDQFKMRDYF